MAEQLKDPQYQARLAAFLEDMAGLLDDVFEAQNLRHTKANQQETLEIPASLFTVCKQAELVDNQVFLSDRLNALLIVQVPAS